MGDNLSLKAKFRELSVLTVRHARLQLAQLSLLTVTLDQPSWLVLGPMFRSSNKHCYGDPYPCSVRTEAVQFGKRSAAV